MTWWVPGSEEKADHELQKAIDQMLSRKQISRIFVVDDDYEADNNTFDDVGFRLSFATGNLALESYAAKHGRQVELQSNGQLLEEDDLIDSLTSAWPSLTDEARADLNALISASVGPVSRDVLAQDQAAALEIDPYIPEGVAVHRLGLTAWTDLQDEIWRDQDTSTLVFFDRDFGKAGGGPKDGDRALSELLRLGLPNLHAGLLTHDPTGPMAIEDELRQSIGPEHHVAVMSKRALEDPREFARELWRYLTVRELNLTRLAVKGAISEALHATQAEEVASSFMLWAAFLAAFREGQYEPDGLLRTIADTFQTQLARSIRKTMDAEALSSLREMATVELYPTGLDRPVGFDQQRRRQNYLEGERLAEFHHPVDLGDVFAIRNAKSAGGSERYYVLAEQACDLAVRDHGGRSNQLTHVTLLSLEPRKVRPSWEPGQSDRSKYADLKPSQLEIGAFDPESDEPWVIDVKNSRYVPLMALDACAVSARGEGTLRTAGVSLQGASIGHQLRAEKLRTTTAKVLDQRAQLEVALKSLPRDTADRLLDSVLRTSLETGTPKTGLSCVADTDQGEIRFGVRRDCRLTGSLARKVLVFAANHRSRPDLENDHVVDPDLNPKEELRA